MIFKLAGEIRVKGEWELEDERVFLGVGEVQLDLSQARISARYPRLTVFCGMGEVWITLPPEIPVLVNGMTALGEREVLGRHDEGIFRRLDRARHGRHLPGRSRGAHHYGHLFDGRGRD